MTGIDERCKVILDRTRHSTKPGTRKTVLELQSSTGSLFVPDDFPCQSITVAKATPDPGRDLGYDLACLLGIVDFVLNHFPVFVV
jgi:hypothetical protein